MRHGFLSIIDVTAASVDDDGFFCRMSKMKTAGNQQKLAWTKARFSRGLGLTLLGDGGRGFVEVIELRSADDVRTLAPSPYDTYAVALDGKLLTSTYELPAALRQKVTAARGATAATTAKATGKTRATRTTTKKKARASR